MKHLKFNTMRHAALVAAVAMGAAVCLPVHAQSTSANINGHGPAGATVDATGSNGTHRAVTIGDNGRYKIGNLPVATYTVKLVKDGNDVDTRQNIKLTVGATAQINFACPNDTCEASGG